MAMSSLLQLLCVSVAVVALSCSLNVSPVYAASGDELELTAWQLQSSAQTTATGGQLSTPGWSPTPPEAAWYNITGPATVLAGLVQAGVYVDPFYSQNLADIPTDPFLVPWWYRTQFTTPGSGTGLVRLQFKGLNYRANVWLNGKLLADDSVAVGSFRYFEFDITAHVAPPGSPNALAVECYRPVDSAFPPTNNDTDLAITFVDWAPPPPDNSMGLWREVMVTASSPGPVVVQYPQVATVLSGDPATPPTPSTLPHSPQQSTVWSSVHTGSGTVAHLTIQAQLRNFATKPVSVVVQAALPGVMAATLQQVVTVPAMASLLLTFDNTTFPSLNVHGPALWWPWQMGPQTLHNVSITVSAATAEATTMSSLQSVFGIRQAESRKSSKGYLTYYINGHALLVRGGGWAPDLFLRYRPTATRIDAHFAYTKTMGLNAIRLEGKMPPDEFFEAADRAGIVTMPGWCCCDAWQHWSDWGPEQLTIATGSLRDQVKRLRRHPSVIAFWYSSDQLPPVHVEQAYLDVFSTEAWPNAVLASASNLTSTITGNTGVKMSGPYAWVPPNYWLLDTPGMASAPEELGGAFGFLTEGGPGASPMPLASLQATIPASKLWPIGAEWDAHCGNPVGLFGDLRFFTPPLEARYGKAHSAANYAYKAQITSYESHRAMFEAYSRNKYTSTGVISWMLNNAFPENMWNLYDYYLVPGGAFFGAQRATAAPLHVQYSYNDATVWLVNNRYSSGATVVQAMLAAQSQHVNASLKAASSVVVTAMVVDINGTVVYKATQQLATASIAPDSAMKVLQLPSTATMRLTTLAYFVRLTLTPGGTTTEAAATAGTPMMLDINTYWLSRSPDVLNWPDSNFYITPCSSFADLTALSTALTPPGAALKVSHTTAAVGPNRFTTTVTVANAGPGVVFGLVARVLQGVSVCGAGCEQGSEAGHAPPDVTPVLWSDNMVTLLPGESRTLVASYALSDAVVCKQCPAEHTGVNSSSGAVDVTVVVSTWNDVVAGGQ